MVVGWLVIAIIAIIVLAVVFKSQDVIYIFGLFKKNFFFVLIIALILFVSFSLYRIHTIYDVSLTSFDGAIRAGRLYLAWLRSLFSNIASITGYAIQQDWVIDNSTNISG